MAQPVALSLWKTREMRRQKAKRKDKNTIAALLAQVDHLRKNEHTLRWEVLSWRSWWQWWCDEDVGDAAEVGVLSHLDQGPAEATQGDNAFEVDDLRCSKKDDEKCDEDVHEKVLQVLCCESFDLHMQEILETHGESDLEDDRSLSQVLSAEAEPDLQGDEEMDKEFVELHCAKTPDIAQAWLAKGADGRRLLRPVVVKQVTTTVQVQARLAEMDKEMKEQLAHTFEQSSNEPDSDEITRLVGMIERLQDSHSQVAQQRETFLRSLMNIEIADLTPIYVNNLLQLMDNGMHQQLLALGGVPKQHSLEGDGISTLHPG